MPLCLTTTEELLTRGAALSSSSHVYGIGLHPWKVPSFSLIDVEALRSQALSLVSKGRSHNLLLMAGETGLDYSVLKRLPPEDREAHKSSQLECLKVLASLSLPLSLHCVKADADLRSTLSSAFETHGPPSFAVIHGYAFKDTGAWLKWSER